MVTMCLQCLQTREKHTRDVVDWSILDTGENEVGPIYAHIHLIFHLLITWSIQWLDGWQFDSKK